MQLFGVLNYNRCHKESEWSYRKCCAMLYIYVYYSAGALRPFLKFFIGLFKSHVWSIFYDMDQVRGLY